MSGGQPLEAVQPADGHALVRPRAVFHPGHRRANRVIRRSVASRKRKRMNGIPGAAQRTAEVSRLRRQTSTARAR